MDFKTNVVKLFPVSAEKAQAQFDGDVTIYEIDSTPNFVKYLVVIDDGKVIYADCDNGKFTYKSNFLI